MTHPLTVTVVIPCHNEEGYVDRLLAGLLPQLSPHWRVVLVDDTSTDATATILADAAASGAHVQVVTGRFGSPGAARSAGVAVALADMPDWLVTVDADVEVTPTWRSDWDESLAQADADCGAINGDEIQDHLYVDLPNAAQVSVAFGLGLMSGERAVGITNLNGVNHAVRASAYLTAGPYTQPTTPGPDGPVSLAGEDWDLGVRIRSAGFSIAETRAAVRDRGRRFLGDVHAYVSGEAYEGAFRRLAPSSGPQDVSASSVPALVDGAVDRSLRHFFLKPILAGATPLTIATGLRVETVEEMQEWMRRWPHPTFEENRNGFVFGRLARFSEAFLSVVRRDLNLELPAVLAHLKGS